MPLYGKLHFVGTKSSRSGESVGREWSYRSYITGPTRRQKGVLRQYAIWDYPYIPAELADRKDPLLYEFAFDIFRLSKGEFEGTGVHCTFTFTDGSIAPERLESLANVAIEEREKRLVAAAKELEAFGRAVTEIRLGQKSQAEQTKLLQDAADQLKEGRDDRFNAAIAGLGAKLAQANADGDNRQDRRRQGQSRRRARTPGRRSCR